MPYDSARPDSTASRRRLTNDLIAAGYLPARGDACFGHMPDLRSGFEIHPRNGDMFFTVDRTKAWCPAWIAVLWEHPSVNKQDSDAFYERVRAMRLRPDRQRAVLMEALMAAKWEKYEKLSIKCAVAALDQREK